MALRFEVFAAGAASPDALWELVGDPRRLPEWTDADTVERVDPEPVEHGGLIVTVDGGRRLTWQVDTLEHRLIEVITLAPRGRLAIGARVVRDPGGSRIILAGALEPSGSRLLARLIDVPRLRSRFDRWSAAALRAAA